MPRRPRGELRGEVHHLLNRGNNRQTLFHKDSDYRCLVECMRVAKVKVPVRIFAFVIMSNHFHLVAQSKDIDTLSRFMHTWMTTHRARYRLDNEGSGHIWQDRFRAFPVQGDGHFLTVARYVLQNPVRANLVENAFDYPWTSLRHPNLIDAWPVAVPSLRSWLAEPTPADRLSDLRTSVRRQLPYGDSAWTKRTRAALGLPPSAPRRGRPPKSGPKSGTGTNFGS